MIIVGLILTFIVLIIGLISMLSKGDFNKKYYENYTPRHVNYYGETKLNAENIILNRSQKNTVLRTAGICGKLERSRLGNWILP